MMARRGSKCRGRYGAHFSMLACRIEPARRASRSPMVGKNVLRKPLPTPGPGSSAMRSSSAPAAVRCSVDPRRQTSESRTASLEAEETTARRALLAQAKFRLDGLLQQQKEQRLACLAAASAQARRDAAAARSQIRPSGVSAAQRSAPFKAPRQEYGSCNRSRTPPARSRRISLGIVVRGGPVSNALLSPVALLSPQSAASRLQSVAPPLHAPRRAIHTENRTAPTRAPRQPIVCQLILQPSGDSVERTMSSEESRRSPVPRVNSEDRRSRDHSPPPKVDEARRRYAQKQVREMRAAVRASPIPAECDGADGTDGPACPQPGLQEIDWVTANEAIEAFCEDGIGEDGKMHIIQVDRVRHSPDLTRKFLAAVDSDPQPARVRAVFHGVTSEPTYENVQRIASEGLDPRKCKAAMFGKGAYVAAAGMKARMYASGAKWDRRHGGCVELHEHPLRILVGVLVTGDIAVGGKGEEHSVVTTDSVTYPTQYCIPVGHEHRLLITHVVTVDPPEPLAATSRTESPPPRSQVRSRSPPPDAVRDVRRAPRSSDSKTPPADLLDLSVTSVTSTQTTRR